MKTLFSGILLCSFGTLLCQEISKETIDEHYLEDQIYTSITYNILIDTPNGVNQKGFSGGFSLGFIKDIPFNSKRTFGMAIGIGYNYNAYIQNILFTDNNKLITATLASDYNSNRFVSNSVEFPLEFRWRTSSPSNYKFTRVYIGGKIGYAFQTRSKFSNDYGVIKTKNVAAFNKINYGLTLAIGYSTFNLYMYYGIKPLFKSLQIDQDPIDMKELQVGFKFYIL